MKIRVITFLILTLFLSAFFTVSAAGEVAAAKKKFLFIKDDDSDFFNGFATFIEKQVREKGYTEDKVEFKLLSMNGKGPNGPSVLKETIEYNPTVVVVNSAYMRDIIIPLQKAKIPTVIFGGIEYEENGKKLFLNDKGMPNSCIMGTFITLEDIELNTFKMMERIDPLKGRKIALMIGNEVALIQKKKIEKAAKDFKAKIKNYDTVKYVEDMQK